MLAQFCKLVKIKSFKFPGVTLVVSLLLRSSIKFGKA